MNQDPEDLRDSILKELMKELSDLRRRVERVETQIQRLVEGQSAPPPTQK